MVRQTLYTCAMFSTRTHLLLCVIASLSTCSSSRDVLYIMPSLSYPPEQPVTRRIWQPNWEDGEHIFPALVLAVEQINNRTDILPHYRLELVDNSASRMFNDGCNVAPSTYLGIAEAVYYFRAKQVLPIAVIGPRCSDSALSAAQMISERFQPLPLFHLGMIPKLSEYSYTLGVVGSLSATVDALVGLMEHNEWTKISILYKGTDTDHFTLYEELGSKMSQSYDILVSLPVTTTYFPLEEVRDSLTRVIFAFVDREILQILMCLAFHEDIMFPTYQWVFIHHGQSFNNNFTNENYDLNGKNYMCSEKEIQHALNGSITVYINLEPGDNDTVLVSNETYGEYLEKLQHYSELRGTRYMRTVWANPAYDAVWSLALALNTTSAEIGHNTTISNDHIERIMYNIYNQDSFVGASGNVSFQNGTGYAGRSFGICQYSDGQCEYVGCYENGIVITGSLDFIDDDFMTMEIRVPFPYAIGALVVTAIPLVLTVIAQIVGFIYRDHPAIKGSSHKLNQLAYFGEYSIAAGIVLVNVNCVFTLQTMVHEVLCMASSWTFSIGTCLVMATMCMKIRRLYSIYSAASKLHPVKNPKLLTDYALSVGVVCLTSVVVCVCLTWTVLDWPVWTVTEAEITGHDPPVNSTISECRSEYSDVWWLVILGYECAICTYTFVLAFLSRKIEQKGLHVTNVIILAYVQILILGFSVPLYVVLSTVASRFEYFSPSFLFYIVLANAIMHNFVFVLFLPPVVLLFKLKWKGEEKCLISHRSSIFNSQRQK